MALVLFLNLSPALINIGAYAAKGLLFVATMLVMRRNIQQETFFPAKGNDCTMPSLP
jgi:hypothetical protein